MHKGFFPYTKLLRTTYKSKVMSKKLAFWSIWIGFTLFIIVFFFALGELKQVDLGKAVILTSIPLISAIPIYYWVRKNDEFY